MRRIGDTESGAMPAAVFRSRPPKLELCTVEPRDLRNSLNAKF